MSRHEFLRHLHVLAAPRTYLEIGVNDGRSLALSRTSSIAIDPAFRITVPLRCNLDLVRATSDDFFAGPDPLAHFRGILGAAAGGTGDGDGAADAGVRPLIDLAFIDGMHHFEFALRDFMNVERHADWWSLIVFDDMLPRSVAEAARDRHSREWAGDVFKIVPVLARHRPDLILVPVDTAPTGVLVVLGADPANDVLRERYEEIVAEWVVPDPQLVPPATLGREGAFDPEALLESGIWPGLVRARLAATPREPGCELVRQRLATVTHR